MINAIRHCLDAPGIRLPAPAAPPIERPWLAQKLSAGLKRPLTVVSAPAGYGKTTTVASALRGLAGEFLPAWLSLDGEDRHVVRFLYHLVAAVQTVAPEVGRAPIFLVGRLQLPDPTHMITALVAEIADSARQIVLVLDDYQVIASAEIHTAIAFLVESMPENLRLVLISRSVPDLPLARWRTQQRLSELGVGDLRFSFDDSARFLQETMGLSIDARHVRALEQKTEGWVAGLQMAALSLQHAAGRESADDFAERVAAFGGEHRHVLDYLAEEVFRRQPGEVQDFLRRTSALDELTASLCDAVTGGDGSRRLLRRLEQANMFIQRVDDGRQCYRYHQLFAEFLASECDAEEKLRQHRRASEWYEAHGYAEKAIRHALAARDHASTVRLLREFASSVLARGELSKLRAWLDELPDEVVRAHSDLACYKAWTLCLNGQTAQAQPYSQLARELERDSDPEHQRGMLAAIHAYIALSWHDPGDAVVFAEQALRRLENSASFFRIYALSLLGQAQALVGEHRAASETLSRGVQLGQQFDNPFMTIDAMGPLLGIMVTQGQLREAKCLCESTIARHLGARGEPTLVAALLYVKLGSILYEQSEFGPARSSLQTGIDLSRQLGMVFYSLLGLCALARLQHVCGEREAAWNTLAAASEIAQRPQSDRRRRLIAEVVAECQLREGNVEGAARTLDAWRGRGRGGGGEAEELLGARILLARNQPTRAFSALLQLEEKLRRERLDGSLIAVHVAQALCKRALGEKTCAARYLVDAVSLAASAGYRRVFLDEGGAIAELLDEVRHADPGFVSDLLGRFALDAAKSTSPGPAPAGSLNRTEREILKLVNLGLTNQQVGERVGIATSTTKWYLTQIFGKLSARNRTQAIARARECGLL